MKKTLTALVTALVIGSPAMLYAATPTTSNDPIVQHRMEVKDARKQYSADVAVANKNYKAAKAKAAEELKADQKANIDKATASKAEGKDPLVVKRELNSQSKTAYKEKVSAASATLVSEKKAAKDKLNQVLADSDAKVKASK